MSDSEQAVEKSPEKPAPVKRAPTESQGNKDVWGLAFEIEKRLKSSGIVLREEYAAGGVSAVAAVSPNVRQYFIDQTHGPFTTRGEAIQYALFKVAGLLPE